MTNERFNVPSASELFRIVKCPNSHQAQKGIADDASSDSSFGDHVHAFISGDLSWEKLTSEEQRSADSCCDMEQWHVDAWKEDGELTYIRETRLGLTAMGTVLETAKFPNANYIFTGKMDCLVIQGKRGLLIEFKSLHPDVEDPVDNEQIMSNAVLCAIRYNLDSVRGVLVAPNQARRYPVDIDMTGINSAKRWLFDLLSRERNSTEADRVAGKWCKHCKAAGICKTLKDTVHRSLEIVDPIRIAGLPPEQQRSAMWAIIMSKTPEQHEAAFYGTEMHQRFVDVIRDSFTERVKAGEMPGWTTKETPGNREVEDAQKAYELLAPLGVTQEQVLKACKPSVTMLDEAVRVASGVKTVTASGAVKYNLTAKEAKALTEQKLGSEMTRGKDRVKIIKINQIEE